MRVQARYALPLIVAIAVSGCSPATTPLPDGIAERTPLASCGELVVHLGETIPIEPRVCLRNAATRAGAELIVTTSTTEGDPIRRFYRVGPQIDGVEVIVDNSGDRFGSGGWTTNSCPGAVTVTEYGTCPDAK
ncbi:MAG: hypothetical protein H7146_03105 [Burkholderiaceae bacterium]|nr:hypothetical protein [Microbacteriaceae bacterium]